MAFDDFQHADEPVFTLGDLQGERRKKGSFSLEVGFRLGDVEGSSRNVGVDFMGDVEDQINAELG